jgi:hypothetical protein
VGYGGSTGAAASVAPNPAGGANPNQNPLTAALAPGATPATGSIIGYERGGYNPNAQGFSPVYQQAPNIAAQNALVASGQLVMDMSGGPGDGGLMPGNGVPLNIGPQFGVAPGGGVGAPNYPVGGSNQAPAVGGGGGVGSDSGISSPVGGAVGNYGYGTAQPATPTPAPSTQAAETVGAAPTITPAQQQNALLAALGNYYGNGQPG